MDRPIEMTDTTKSHSIEAESHHSHLMPPSPPPDAPADMPLRHSMMPPDPANPMNWSLHRRIYVSAASWVAGFAVAFGITCYTAGVNEVATEFSVSSTTSILGMSMYILGIVFAPIYVPHVAVRTGRSSIYLTSLLICGLFSIAAARATTIAELIVFRFLAGLCGGPCLVLIEGTFADIWAAETTNTYYAILGLSSYVGAATGPLIGGFVVASKGWRWTQYLTAIVAFGALLFACGMSESFFQSRRRMSVKLSGVTFGEMVKNTVTTPLIMLVSEPVVIMCSLYLALNFGLVFQWFITVPAVLTGVYNLTLSQAGIAFTSAIAGGIVATVMSIIVEQFLYRSCRDMMDIENRLIPAILGSFGVAGSLFWVGWSASPTIHFIVPVLGTMVFVWGNLSVVISIIPYIFDAYPAAGTLSALTIMASLRLLFAMAFPLFILQMFAKLGGNWALSVFGFIAIAMIPIPFVLFKWGAKLRARSQYSRRPLMRSYSKLGQMQPVSAAV